MTTTTLRSPAAEYTGPPKDWFLGEEWFRRDLEAVFRPKWLVAGHVDELNDTSQGHPYITYSLGNEEVVIRRDEEGQVRAYHNFCPHRGAQLCKGPAGTAPSKRIVCPYHAWTFSVSDGELLTARKMHEDFDGSGLGLKPVHVEVWNGLIFICLADEAPEPVATLMGDMTFRGYDIKSMKLATVKSHVIEANWKIVVENNLECYHCAVIHPEYMAATNYFDGIQVDFDEERARRAAGLEAFESGGTQEDLRSPLTIGGEKVCAIPTPRTDGDPDPASYFLQWEPGVVLNLARDFGWIFAPRPLGPDRTELRQYWLVAEDAEEGRDYELETLKQFWDITMVQDLEICEAVQHGIEMPAYTPGPLNRVYQYGQAGFYAWYTEQIRAYYPDLVHASKPVLPEG